MTDPIERLLPAVTTPGQYIGHEWNSVPAPSNHGGLKIALALPAAYSRGLREPLLQTLYQTLNDRDDVVAERAFLPLEDMQSVLRAAATRAFSLESRRPLAEFDWVVLIVSDPLTYAGIPMLLELGGIPVDANERRTADPVVIATGACSATPDPFSSFVDLLLAGEPEEEIHVWIDRWMATVATERMTRAAGTNNGADESMHDRTESMHDRTEAMHDRTEAMHDRTEAIRAFSATLDTAYAPACATAHAESPPVVMPWIDDLDQCPIATRPITANVQTRDEQIIVELSRGGGADDRDELQAPLRHRSPARVVEIVEAIARNTGLGRIYLAGDLRTQYPGFDDLIRTLAASFTPRHTPVVVDALPVAPWTRQAIRALGKTYRPKVALNLDAGSERLRDASGRPAANKDIHDLVAEAIHSRIMNLELEFRIGFPGEEDADITALVGLSRDCLAICKKSPAGTKPRIHLRVGYYAPPPFTNEACGPMSSLDELRRKTTYLKDVAGSDAGKFEFVDSPERALLAHALHRGDRRVAGALRRLTPAAACSEVFDEAAWEAWSEAFRSAGLDIESLATSGFDASMDAPSAQRFEWAAAGERIEPVLGVGRTRASDTASSS